MAFETSPESKMEDVPGLIAAFTGTQVDEWVPHRVHAPGNDTCASDEMYTFVRRGGIPEEASVIIDGDDIRLAAYRGRHQVIGIDGDEAREIATPFLRADAALVATMR